MNNIKGYFGLFWVIVISLSSAQLDAQDYWEEDLMRFEDRVYTESIGTVIFTNSVSPLAPPIMKLGSTEKLSLHFDDFNADRRDYAYTVIHCDAWWNASDLDKQEYINGFQENYIRDYRFSLNTFKPYTHYELTIPNRDMSLLVSGNYLLVVYDIDDPDRVVLTRRFMVFERRVSITHNIKRPSTVEYRNTHQEVDFKIQTGSYRVDDPFNAFKVVVIQNRNWNMALYGLQPRFVNGGELDYDYEYENLFPGGNEYRYFDTKDLNILLQRVARIEWDSLFDVYIMQDFPRNIGQYSSMDDINGLRYIRNQRARDNMTESDYARVHFRLNLDEELTTGKVYVFGALTDFNVSPASEMRWDNRTSAYTGELLLKQGYYNYEFVFVPDGKPFTDRSTIEGTHWQTKNEYMILVYNREVGLRYDKLVGVSYENYEVRW
jgi:hypothetical protein